MKELSIVLGAFYAGIVYCSYHVLIVEEMDNAGAPLADVVEGVWRGPKKAQQTEGSTLLHRINCVTEI